MELRPLSKFTSWVDIQSQPAFPSISHFPDLPCLRVRGPQRTQTSFHSNFWSVLPHPQKIDNLSHLHACSVVKSCLTCSPPGSSIHGIFQARILEWVTISYSRNNKSSLILHPGIKPVCKKRILESQLKHLIPRKLCLNLRGGLQNSRGRGQGLQKHWPSCYLICKRDAGTPAQSSPKR